jgi:hypothetical protein
LCSAGASRLQSTAALQHGRVQSTPSAPSEEAMESPSGTTSLLGAPDSAANHAAPDVEQPSQPETCGSHFPSGCQSGHCADRDSSRPGRMGRESRAASAEPGARCKEPKGGGWARCSRCLPSRPWLYPGVRRCAVVSLVSGLGPLPHRRSVLTLCRGACDFTDIAPARTRRHGSARDKYHRAVCAKEGVVARQHRSHCLDPPLRHTHGLAAVSVASRGHGPPDGRRRRR